MQEIYSCDDVELAEVRIEAERVFMFYEQIADLCFQVAETEHPELVHSEHLVVQREQVEKHSSRFEEMPYVYTALSQETV